MIPNVLVCLFLFALLFLLLSQGDKKYSIYILRVRSTKYIHKQYIHSSKLVAGRR